MLFSYAEEMLARDVYNYLDELYPETDVFGHIAQSEQKHMDAVSKLIDKANLEAPTGYGELTDTYNALISQGSESLQQALEVGVQIEILDIDDLKHMMSEIDNETINSTFTRIGDASYTHLAAFMSELQKNGFDSQHDWDNYISQEDIDNMKDHSSQNRGHGKDRDKDCDRMNTGQEGSENGHGKQMQR
ncbi:MAG: DUF2202 domain-containing protein [Patescibacteria group bacterium]|nr:DUF2202 domain-containing protein [Patescibacteria group bacterium]